LRAPVEYERYQADGEAALAFQHPTDLKAVPVGTFDRIARHGYELTDCTLTTYAAANFAKSYIWQ
jgi:hypothetical protein